MEEINDNRRVAIKKELDHIRQIWDTYFLDFNICRKEMASPAGISHSYFGQIMGNFEDTIDVVYGRRNEMTIVSCYSGQMSLMQSIYVQQDFIEELLWIFKCGIDKSKLKKDETYSLNRELRNELFGHPIRRVKGVLISTTLIAYNGQKDCINYMRYHKENNYKFQSISFKIEEIIERHTKFLLFYLGKILVRMKKVLRVFKRQLQQLDTVLNNKDSSFEIIINLTALHFEAIFKSGELYDKETILQVYAKRKSHQRYQQLIDSFLKELKNSIKDHFQNIEEIMNPIEPEELIAAPLISIQELIDNGSITIVRSPEELKTQEETYHYELGKLATNPDLFDYCYRVLQDKCSENNLVLGELDFMRENRFRRIEYFSALNLIRVVLDHDN